MTRRLLLGFVLAALAVAPAAAEPTWKLEASDTSYSYVCGSNKDWLVVRGSSNSITITGECGQLDVTGSDNRVTIEAVATVRVTGNNNDVRYERVVGGKRRPVIKKKGAANTVRRSE